MDTATSHSCSPPLPPEHVAIIMDGNGRWAQTRGLPRVLGHQNGTEAVRRATESAFKHGVRYLTLFGFSSENWKRPSEEIDELMGLLRRYLRSEIAELHKNGVRMRVIGERQRLSMDIVKLIEDCEARTAENTNLNLIFALNYGGRADLASAARSLAEKVERGQISFDEIDEATFGDHLSTAGIPDPDLLIRTSGEKRISNFLLWQLAYSEFIFLETLWPDFAEEDFAKALSEFHQRERRYGATGT